MSNFLNKIKVMTGLQAKRNKFDLSCTHITTQDFYQNVPIYIKEMIPGESIKINLNSFTRCAPLTQPLFGSIKTNTRAFFVPMRTIMYGFNQFITGTPCAGINSDGSAAMIGFVPRFQMKELYDVILTTTNGYVYAIGDQTSTNYDLYGKTSASGSVATKCNLTNSGRLLLKLLSSLGYKLNIASTTSTYNDNDSTMFVSAMPLLAFAKVWSDWFLNSQYNTELKLNRFFIHASAAYQLTAADLQEIFVAVREVNYAEDYFTAAWDNPAGPNNIVSGGSLLGPSLEQPINIPDNTIHTTSFNGQNEVAAGYQSYGGSSDTVANNGTPAIYQKSSSGVSTGSNPITHVSQFMIDALHSVTDFVKRHQMVGSRALDRYMAEYGIQLKSEKLNRSVYIGKTIGDFQIADVTQTAPDSGLATTGVGAYTGKMIGTQGGNFEYTTDEYGYIIITTYIEPKNMYVDGRPRYLQHTSKFDFFTGDFDNLGVQAIREDEVSSNGLRSIYPTGYRANGIFGYTPRYSEYKVGFDNLTGDFLYRSTNQSLDGWYLARRMALDTSNAETTHDKAFCVADGSDYASLFQDQTNSADHFFTVFRFNVDCYAPMKTMMDMYDYSNEDGKQITANLNGTTLSD